MINTHILFGGFLPFLVLSGVHSKYECIVGPRGEYENYGGYEADEFEPGEYGEFGDDMAGYGVFRPSGRLRCSTGDGAKILVKRIAFGANPYGQCNSNGYCQEEFDSGERLAAHCDGRATCSVDMRQPTFLRCGRMSTYMMVEYECLKSSTTIEVCNSISTVVPGPTISIVSPGHLESRPSGPRRTPQACDCIIQSTAKADIHLDYIQTNMANDGDFCPYEYVRIESKSNINQTQTDQQLEACGRRRVSQRWFQGTIRLSYASGEQTHPRDFIAKFTVDNRGNAPQINIECGPADASNLNLKKKSSAPWQPLSPRYPGPPPFGYPPMGPPLVGPGMPPFNLRAAFDDGLMDQSPILDDGPPLLLSAFQQPFMRPSPPPRKRAPDLSKWKINLPPVTKPPAVKPFTNQPAPAPPLRKAPKPPVKPRPEPKPPMNKRKPPERGRKPPSRSGNGGKRGPAKRNKAGRIVDDAVNVNTEEKTVTEKTTSKGGSLGIIIGSIGAVLILGSVGILVIHNHRKRQRIKRQEAEYEIEYTSDDPGASSCSGYGDGWPGGTEESVYATVAEVDQQRKNNKHDKLKRNKQESTVTESKIGKQAAIPASKTGKQAAPAAPVSESQGEFVNERRETSIPASGVPSTSTKIAVIEVHRTHDDKNVTLNMRTADCSQPCDFEMSAMACKSDECDVYCKSCSITRPPRRRDTQKGYDNNVGVRKNTN